MSIAVVSVVVVSCVVPFAAANSLLTNTPLYTYRMEQASSRMNFLPIEKNSFTYAADGGYILNHEVLRCCGGVSPLMTEGSTCNPTCDEKTCITCLTCASCFLCETSETCDTCSTCNPTCSSATCSGPWCS